MTSHYADAVDEGEGPDHCSRVNENVVKEAKQKERIEDPHGYRDAPQGPLGAYLVQEGVVDQQACRKASPGHQTEPSEGLMLHHDETDQAADHD